MIVDLGAGHQFDVTRRPVVVGVVPGRRRTGGPPSGTETGWEADVAALLEAGVDAIELPGPVPATAGPAVTAPAFTHLRRAIEAVRSRFDGPVLVQAGGDEVAEAALQTGASAVAVAAASSPGVFTACAQHAAAVVVTHEGSGGPRRVRAVLADAAAVAEAAGVPRSRIVLDDGIGLGKTAGDSLELLGGSHGLPPGHAWALSVHGAAFLDAVVARRGGSDRQAEHAAQVVGLWAGRRVVRTSDPRGTRRIAHLVASLSSEQTGEGPHRRPVGVAP